MLGLVILQLLAKGLDSQDVRDACVKVLREELRPTQSSNGPTRACANLKA